MHRLFSNRRLFFLAVILIVSNIVITGVSLIVIYNKSISSIENSLIDIVERQKSLVTTLYEQGKTEQEIIQFIKIMREKHYSIGQSGEFVIARRYGDSANFLLSIGKIPVFDIYNAENNGLPMRLAFQNKTGFIKAKDYAGTTVLAAYTYIPALKWGIVAKIPTSEVNQSYYQAFIWALLIFIILLSLSILIFVKISNPIIKGIIDSENKFRRAIQNAPFPIMIHAEDGEVMNISQGWTDITGYSLSDIPTIDKWTERAYGLEKKNVKEYIDTIYNLESSRNDGEFTIKCSNSSERIWDFSSTPLGKLNDGRRAVISIAKDVTERKQEEDHIRQSEEKFSFLFSEMSSGCSIQEIICNNQGIPVDYLTLDCNKSFERLLNVNKKDVIGLRASAFLTEIELKNWLQIFGEVAQNGISKTYEQFSPANNKYFSGVVFSPKRGTFAVTFEDVTERKLAEEALKKSEEKYRLIAENVSDVIWIISTVTHKYSYISPSIFQLRGYTAEEAMEQDIFQSATPESVQLLLEQLPSRIQSYIENPEFNQTYLNLLQLPCKNGSLVWVEAATHFQTNKAGEIEVFGISRNVTERKKIEDELIKAKEKAEESEKNLKRIIDHSPLPMVISVENKYVEFVNEKFTQLYGYTQSDISTAEKWYQCAYPDEEYRRNILSKWRTAIEKAAKDNTEVEPQTYTMTTKDGTNRDCEFYMVIMGNRSVIVANDITERKKFENELIIAKESAEESDRLKTAFLQNMSHEIRTPMNAIMGFSELLVQNYNNQPKLEKFSQIINQRCEDLLEIINDILDIAKIESGQLPVNIEQCNLNELFIELTTFFHEYQTRINKQHINFKMHALDEPTANAIMTDRVKLKQIFINLIGNAFKFIDNGDILVGCNLDNNHNITFYVSDTGIGIPSDKYDKIFERFTQLKHLNNQAIGGTGLGLSIVKGLINLLEGKIWVNSELKKGSTFYFSIPYKTSPLLQHKPNIITEPREYYFPNKKILIVEDDHYNADFIKEILSGTGLDVIHTEYGEEAVQIATSQYIDLVLMDIQLPDINGYEATRLIKKTNPNIKIIAQTAYAAFEDKQKAFDAGCIDYISKPLKGKLMLSMISKYINEK